MSIFLSFDVLWLNILTLLIVTGIIYYYTKIIVYLTDNEVIKSKIAKILLGILTFIVYAYLVLQFVYSFDTSLRTVIHWPF